MDKLQTDVASVIPLLLKISGAIGAGILALVQYMPNFASNINSNVLNSTLTYLDSWLSFFFPRWSFSSRIFGLILFISYLYLGIYFSAYFAFNGIIGKNELEEKEELFYKQLRKVCGCKIP